MKRSYFGVYLAIVIFATLGIFFPILILGSVIPKSLAEFLFVFIIFYSSLRLTIVSLSLKRRIMEMFFYIYVYLFLGISALSQIKNNIFYWPGNYNESDFIVGALIIILGLLFYDLAIFLTRSNIINSRKINSRKVDINLNLSIKRMKVFSLFCFLLCFVSVILLGGPDILFSTRGEIGGVLDQTQSLIILGLLRVPVFVALLFVLVTYLKRENKLSMTKTNFFLLIMLAVLFVTNMIVSNPLSTPRFWFGTIILSVLLIIIKWSSKTISMLIIFIIFSMLFVFPNSDMFRYGTEAKFNISSFNDVVHHGDYDSFQQVMNTKNYTEQFGYRHGQQLVTTFLFWAPRSIWSEKSYGTGMVVAEGMGYSYTNLSAPLWAEFYIDFGMLGILLFFLVYGWISGKLQISYLNSTLDNKITLWTILVPVVAAYQLFLLRGQLLSTFPFLALIIFFCILGNFNCLKSTRKRRCT